MSDKMNEVQARLDELFGHDEPKKEQGSKQPSAPPGMRRRNSLETILGYPEFVSVEPDKPKWTRPRPQKKSEPEIWGGGLAELLASDSNDKTTNAPDRSDGDGDDE